VFVALQLSCLAHKKLDARNSSLGSLASAAEARV
jgi:hypothetical protein